MNDFELKTETVLQWALKYKTPSEFICCLEQHPVPSNKKGGFFLEVGIILYENQNFVFAIYAWKNALSHFIKIEDPFGELWLSLIHI